MDQLVFKMIAIISSLLELSCSVSQKCVEELFLVVQ